MSWSWIGFLLPLGLNSVEGSEAALLAAAASTRGSWRKVVIALIAAAVTLVPFAVGLYFLFQVVPGAYIDYAIAAVIFLLGVREVREGLQERGEEEEEGESAGEPDARGNGAAPLPLGFDAVDAASVERFQRRHGIDPSGEVDEETWAGLLRERTLTGGVDITDAGAVEEFQRRRGVRPSGAVDVATQQALIGARVELRRSHPDEGDGLEDGAPPSWLPVEPTDAESIVEFQRGHGLAADGVIGPRTQAALRAVLIEMGEEDEGDQEGMAGKMGSFAPVWPAYVGGVLEGGEAVLYTFGVAHGSPGWLAPAAGGAIGFSLPWVALVPLRRLIDRLPEWKVELSIGIVLMSAASVFGVLRAVGVLGG